MFAFVSHWGLDATHYRAVGEHIAQRIMCERSGLSIKVKKILLISFHGLSLTIA